MRCRPPSLWSAFSDEYLPDPTRPWGRFALEGTRLSTSAGEHRLEADVVVDGSPTTLEGAGNGPLDAFSAALSGVDVDVRVLDYHEHALSSGEDASAAAYVECAVGGRVLWGVGIDSNIVTASLKAVVSAVNRAARDAA
ncbi:hypothetical protein GCM10025868_08680 [Angustibacter aerolatus]|uniref:2-isopropylmalate synthase LeuA allosteric (dimerisation) domain-containing protein n=1 Tax=Angustibacter aerolatus TaxID=1162965 RepID=A0ABQ6JBR3_9ACTN|nr:alpha-isopropylmalate synthase regulatory domain-containing protein [Angustibacter aerolatus]GMA85618.1 hypothetical protein GCM10025868_08680 [Angustibacter aerolatus]